MRVLDLLPARTVLLPIDPIDPESSTREALTSYFRRVCGANGLRVSRVFSALVVPRLSGVKISGRRSDHPAYDDHLVNSGGKPASEWVMALESLTGTKGLHRLTLLDSRNEPTRLVVVPERHRKWCPACYQQMLDRGSPFYDQLAWTIRGFDCCPEHRLTLRNICPHCQKGPFQHFSGNDVAGFCPHCHKWLGSGISGPEGQREAETDYSLWTARSIATLLAINDVPRAACEDPDAWTVSSLINRHFDGSGAAFGELLARSKSVVSGWRHGKSVPSWEAWCQMSYCFAIPLRNLIMGDVDNLTLPPPRRLPLVRATTRRRPKRRNWKKIGTLLREMAEKKSERFDGLEAVARHLGLHARQLNLHFPAECRVLSKLFAAARSRKRALARTKRHLFLSDAVQEAIDLLRVHGQTPSRRNIERVLSLRKIKLHSSKYRLLNECVRSARSNARKSSPSGR